MIATLAAEPMLELDETAIERELRDALLQIRQRASRGRLQELLLKAESSALGPAEQQELELLTTQLSKRDLV